MSTAQNIRRMASLEMKRASQSERWQSLGSSESSRESELNLKQFNPVAFWCLKRENKPRIWFINLVLWPYPFMY